MQSSGIEKTKLINKPLIYIDFVEENNNILNI